MTRSDDPFKRYEPTSSRSKDSMSYLNTLGVIPWIGVKTADFVDGTSWLVALGVLSLVYFYAHYLFASNTAQITAMYAVFLSTSIAAGRRYGTDVAGHLPFDEGSPSRSRPVSSTAPAELQDVNLWCRRGQVGELVGYGRRQASRRRNDSWISNRN